MLLTGWLSGPSYLIFSGSLNKNRGKTLGNHDYFKNNAQVRVTIVVGPMEKGARGPRGSGFVGHVDKYPSNSFTVIWLLLYQVLQLFLGPVA